MRSKVREKEKAISLRKKGYTYNEILKEIHVSRSSLSLWLKDLSLTRLEKQVLKKRKTANISRGRIKAAASQYRNKEARIQRMFEEAQKEFDVFKDSHLFQVGIALYWAEGAKRNTFFAFSNSDVKMVSLMLEWMEIFLGMDRKNVHTRLYIHKPYATENCENYWATRLHIPEEVFKKTIYKKTRSLVKRRPQYKGVLRISTNMAHLRKLKFWIQMLVEYHAKQ